MHARHRCNITRRATRFAQRFPPQCIPFLASHLSLFRASRARARCHTALHDRDELIDRRAARRDAPRQAGRLAAFTGRAVSAEDELIGWLARRIAQHQAIRDDVLDVLRAVPGLHVRTPEAGSYLFPRLPALQLSLHDFVRALRLQAGVTVTPGTEFSPDAVDTIRLNFSQNHTAAVLSRSS